MKGAMGIRWGLIVVAGLVNAWLAVGRSQDSGALWLHAVAPPLTRIEGLGERTMAPPGAFEGGPPVDMRRVGQAVAMAVQRGATPAQRVALSDIDTLSRHMRDLEHEARRLRVEVEGVAVDLAEALGPARMGEVLYHRAEAAEAVGEVAIWRDLEARLQERNAEGALW